MDYRLASRESVKDRRLADKVLSKLEIAPCTYSLRPPRGTDYVTIRHQQMRSCNLVWSLAVRYGKRFRDLRLTIVGAGVAGLTAAALARRLGLRPDKLLVLEQLEFPMWNLQHGRTRWLHPFRFVWPEREWGRKMLMLPTCNWTAGYAHDVYEQLEAVLTSYRLSPIQNAVIEDSAKRVEGSDEIRLRYCVLGQEQPEVVSDILIYADGLGLEAEEPHAVNSSYWLDDNVHREEPYVKGHVEYALAGNGDGALTDLLRARLASGNRQGPRLHQQIVEMVSPTYIKNNLVEGSDEKSAFRQITLRAREIHRSTRDLPDPEREEEIERQYLALADDFRISVGPTRKRTKVKHIAPSRFSKISFGLNRFLVAQLLRQEAYEGVCTTFERGKAMRAVRSSDRRVAVEVERGTDRRVVYADRLVFRAGSKERPGLSGRTMTPADFTFAETPIFPPSDRLVRWRAELVDHRAVRDAPVRFRMAPLARSAADPRRAGYSTLQITASSDVAKRWRRHAPATLLFDHATGRGSLAGRVTLHRVPGGLARLRFRTHVLSSDEVLLVEFVRTLRGSGHVVQTKRFAVCAELPCGRGKVACMKSLLGALFAGAGTVICFDRKVEEEGALAWKRETLARRPGTPDFNLVVCGLDDFYWVPNEVEDDGTELELGTTGRILDDT